MALSEDFSFVHGGLTVGEGTDYALGSDITGLGMPAYRSVDGARGLTDGDVGGVDHLEARILTFPITVKGAGTCEDNLFDGRRAASGVLLQTLLAAWKPARTDEPLDLRVPGLPETEVRFYGRPRGVDVSFVAGVPHIPTLLTFKCLDPFKYGAETARDGLTGAVTVVNAGDAATDRCTVTITGTGAIPLLNNASDGHGYVTFAAGLAAGQTRILDLRARTCVDETGGDHYDELAAGITWFALQPGNNSVALSGGTFDFLYRPAWH